jgi:hypothetical protein
VARDGTLNLLEAVKAGFTNPSDFSGWNVTEQDIQDALKLSGATEDTKALAKYRDATGSYNVAQAIKDGVDYELLRRVFGITRQQYAYYNVPTTATSSGEARDNSALQPYVKDDGSLDLVAAVKSGITDPKSYEGWNVTSKTITDVEDYIKASDARGVLDKYKTGEGSYDIYAAIRGGVSKEAIQLTFGLSDEEYRNYELTAPYVKDGDVDLEAAIKAANGGWEHEPVRDIKGEQFANLKTGKIYASLAEAARAGCKKVGVVGSEGSSCDTTTGL